MNETETLRVFISVSHHISRHKVSTLKTGYDINIYYYN